MRQSEGNAKLPANGDPRFTRNVRATCRGLRHRESGFALLLVFLMAAVIAITLYAEIPRIAFDAQRQKEQLLISRGEQYKRAIQLFMVANKRWPAKIEELESLNNRRYLRKRFVDPMTGKDEWRMIHIANGMLTDSVVTKPPAAADPKSADTFAWGASSIGVQAGMGQTPAGGGAQGGVNLANRRRASDGMAPGVGDGQTPVDPNNPQQYPGMPGVPPQTGTGSQQYPVTVIPPGVPGIPGIPGMPGVTGATGQYPGQYPGQFPGQPVQQLPGQYPGNGIQPGMPGQQQYPGQTGPYPGQPQQFPGQQPFPGQQQFPGQPVNSQTGGVSPYPIVPGSNGVPPGFPQPGNPINPQIQGANQAQMMIQQILTTPRPGGAPGAAPGPMMGGGIAGVASNGDADSIMLYNDRTNYKEWEFVFDPNKLKPVPNPLGGGAGTPVQQMGSPIGTPIGTPVTSMGAPGATGATQPVGGRVY